MRVMRYRRYGILAGFGMLVGLGTAATIGRFYNYQPEPPAGSVKLIWAPNTEADLDHYGVYWAQSDGPSTPVVTGFQCVAVLPSGEPEPNYLFTAGGPGVRDTWNWFFVTATDQAGNESDPSEIVLAGPEVWDRKPRVIGGVRREIVR